ncbi:MAG: hypothetical protein HC834_05895 [Rhodospirillales bacterium]|nr:hypothetical protein [Rhodospirillales bacterium]
MLKFDRNWASFDFPQFLMALQRIQQAVFSAQNLPFGDYAFFAKQVESLFRPEICAALDEYGIPSSVAQKCPFLADAPDLETAFQGLLEQDLTRLQVHPYEAELLESARQGMRVQD